MHTNTNNEDNHEPAHVGELFGQVAYDIADADSRSLIEAQKQFRRSIQRVVENDDALIDENEAASMMIALNSSTLAVMIHKINELEERLTTLEADGFRRN